MRLSCLINNYNYGRYLADAVESALNQTTPFDEVIVVDDGSDDHSAGVLAAMANRCERVRVIHKPNGGQLSSFHTGFENSTGDVIFFLDADDVFAENYVERMVAVYESRPEVDYAFCGRHLFGRVEQIDRPYEVETDLGYSTAVVALGRFWLGASTSCVSLRRSTLQQILPAPELEPSWAINADVCLAYGASLAGARKYCVPEPLVGYRVHSANRYYGRGEDASGKYQRRLKTHALVEYYVRRFGYDHAELARLLHLEFATIPAPSRTQYKRYVRTALAAPTSIWRRLWQTLQMRRHYRSKQTAAARAAKESTTVRKAAIPPTARAA
ncbi:glycosyltransferase family 2 protein [Botrimarina hoheduenensis]|uniref:Putative glycosyltransferase EpsJ n=1 Tax=Botrimarina hoheduenensis TaxID=2528000 RepID=A0A5C5W9R6_9BACT|nr:glycosyltransferase family A protein [Botrimarina hoheduenensis]TWT47400.1 putative glycosyltransferase EpsJ [Botrimarina hoheduenensis]